MERLPAIELLERTHQFPCPYTFKVIGRSERGFAARVVAAVRQVLQQDVDPPHRLRHTAGGRHVAVTLEPEMQSARQVLRVYRRLQDTEGVVLMF